jgi:hypothetical protein
MKGLIVVACWISLETGMAAAQVPVTDSARENKETATANCMTKYKDSKTKTLQPAQGIKGSMAAPTDGGAAAGVGGAGLMGSASTETIGSLGGVNLSSLSGAPPITSDFMGMLSQTLGGLASVSSGVQSNKSGLQTAVAIIGTLSALDNGWRQNSGARLGSAALWGQAIQLGTTMLQLRQNELLRQTAGASAASQVMTYDPAKARLVGP